MRARDDLADMFVRRMGAIHKRASDELEAIQRKQRDQVEDLVGLLDGVVDILADESDETAIARAGQEPARAERRSGAVARELCGNSRVQRPQLSTVAQEAFQGAPFGHDACRPYAQLGFDQPGPLAAECTRCRAGE